MGRDHEATYSLNFRGLPVAGAGCRDQYPCIFASAFACPDSSIASEDDALDDAALHRLISPVI
jgi:hypothetical protein